MILLQTHRGRGEYQCLSVSNLWDRCLSFESAPLISKKVQSDVTPVSGRHPGRNRIGCEVLISIGCEAEDGNAEAKRRVGRHEYQRKRKVTLNATRTAWRNARSIWLTIHSKISNRLHPNKDGSKKFVAPCSPFITHLVDRDAASPTLASN